MKINKLLIVSTSVISAGLCISCNNVNKLSNIQTIVSPSQSIVYPETYEKKSRFMDLYFQEEMPIFGYITMPPDNAADNGVSTGNPSHVSYQTFQMYKDAGFNVVIPVFSITSMKTPSVRREIEICNDLGLYYLPKDPNFSGERNKGKKDIVSADRYFELLNNKENTWYLDEPCVIGMQVKDEPNVYDLDSIGNFYHALGEYDDTKWAFNNLFPIGAKDEQLGLEDYEESTDHAARYRAYIEKYLTVTNSPYILYDLYFNHSGERPLNTETTRNFMTYLSYFSNIARKNDIDFMVAAAPYRHAIKQNMRVQELRWTVNMSLAYGAKGVEYYTYWPASGSLAPSKWTNPARSGLVTANGIPHDSYYHAKEINENIRVIDEYLMAADFLGYSYFGDRIIHLETKDAIETNPLARISGGNAFVGVFNYHDKQMYYVVNNSIDGETKTFMAEFYQKVNVHLHSAKLDAVKNNKYAVGFNLEPGEGMLIEVL